MGKFLQVDPKADKYGSLTTYNYAGNNPVVFNDPLGDEIDWGALVDALPDGEWTWHNDGPQDASANGSGGEGFANMFGGAENAFQVADAMHDALNGRYNALWNSMCYGSRMGANGATDKGALYGYGRWVHKDFYNVTTVNGEEVGREFTHTEVTWESVQEEVSAQTECWWCTDRQGEFFFDHWRHGGGRELFLNDAEWGNYMRSDHVLHEVSIAKSLYALGVKNTGWIKGTLHADTGATGTDTISTGLGMLGGSNSRVGDVEYSGYAYAHNDGTGTISYLLTFVWHDIMDANLQYNEDKLGTTIYTGTDYNVHITWTEIIHITPNK